MTEIPTADRIALLLEEVGAGPDGSSPGAIADALASGTSLATRVELLSTLSAMAEDGLVVRDAGGDHDGVRYRLTEEGLDRAARVRERLAAVSVRLPTGDDRTVPATELTDHLDAETLAAALGRVSADGRVYPRQDGDPDPFVGRAAELEVLRERMEVSPDDGPTVTVVAGGAGTGKTRLLDRVTERAREDGIVATTTSVRPVADEPYAPLHRVLEEHLAAIDRTPFADAGPAAEHATSLDAPLRGDDRRASLALSLADAIEALPPNPPRVLALDDVHLADPATTAVLRSTLEAVETAPIAVVLTTRSSALEDDGDLGGLADRATLVRLGPLDRAETGSLVRQFLGESRVPDGFVDQCHDLTGGRPLFVRAVLERLRESGELQPGQNVYPDLEENPVVPERVEETIDDRLATLDATGRAVIKTGAVIGARVPRDVLAAAVDTEETAVAEYADVLVGAGLWRRVDGGDAYRFESEAVRETVLGRIDPEHRTAIEGRVAAASEAIRGEDVDHLGAIARHHRRAGNDERALESYRRAGRRAVELAAHEVAIEHYEHALALARELDRDDAVLASLQRLARLAYIDGDFAAAEKYSRYVHDRSGDPVRRQRALLYVAQIAWERGDDGTATDALDRGLGIEDGEDELRCLLLDTLGWIHLSRGETAAAAETVREAADLAGAVGTPRALSKTLCSLGAVHFVDGDIQTGIERTREALAEIPDDGAPPVSVPATRSNLAAMLRERGDFAAAVTECDRALAAADEYAERYTESQIRTNRAESLRGLKRWEEALSEAGTAIEVAERLGQRRTKVAPMTTRGAMLLERGSLDEAAETLETALELAEASEYRRFVGRIRAVLARLHTVAGELGTAAEHASTALEATAESHPATASLARARLGDVERARGNHTTAIEHYRAGADLGADSGRPRRVAENRLGLAAAHRATDDLEAGFEAAVDAVARATESPLPTVLGRAQRERAELHRLRGEHRAALRSADDALDRATAVEARVLRCTALATRSRVCRDGSDEEAARRAIAESRELAGSIGAGGLLARVRGAAGDLLGDAGE